jgi:hypothetical protein
MRLAAEHWRHVVEISQSGVFDADWYCATYPDVKAAGVDPLEHFVVYGWREGRDPSPLFSVRYYLEENPDVAAGDLNPLTHYLLWGWREGRRPRPGLDQAAYLEGHGLANGVPPLVHEAAQRRAGGISTAPAGPRTQDGEAASVRREAAYPAGHFHSPVVDTGDVADRRADIWPRVPRATIGIDWNDASHRQVLTEFFPRWLGDWDYPETLDEECSPGKFYTRNGQFSWLDARCLFVLLRQYRPRRMIEVGSGYSSLLSADVNRRFLGGGMNLTCIDPYPRTFLRRRVDGLTRVLDVRVERVSLSLFETLEPGDLLFIDSSHVAKTGSDVNFLLFEVLPRLRPRVLVHVHDIHLPFEYPERWVLAENRSWNEQYLVRALLMYSTGFRVLFGCRYAFHRFPDLVATALAHPRGTGYGGGSLWIERTDARRAHARWAARLLPASVRSTIRRFLS